MQMFKLIALDIDGTMTDSDGAVPMELLYDVQRAQIAGVIVALISARPPAGVDLIARALHPGVFRACYLGAVIENGDRKEVRRCLVDFHAAHRVAAFADANDLSLTINLEDVEYHTQGVERPSMVPRMIVKDALPLLGSGRCPVLIGAEGHKTGKLVDEFCCTHLSNMLHVARHHDESGRITSVLLVHPTARKEDALRMICDQLSIKPELVMAIGDSETDAGMISLAGFGVAVANAEPSVKLAAKICAPFASNNGVAWAIRTFIFNKREQ